MAPELVLLNNAEVYVRFRLTVKINFCKDQPADEHLLTAGLDGPAAASQYPPAPTVNPGGPARASRRRVCAMSGSPALTGAAWLPVRPGRTGRGGQADITVIDRSSPVLDARVAAYAWLVAHHRSSMQACRSDRSARHGERRRFSWARGEEAGGVRSRGTVAARAGRAGLGHHARGNQAASTPTLQPPPEAGRPTDGEGGRGCRH